MNTGKINWAGHDSSDFAVYVSGTNAHNAAEPDMVAYSIAGRNGDFVVSNNRYKNIKVTYPAFVARGFAANEQSIRNWLRTTNFYTEITDTYDTSHYRLGRVIGELQFEPARYDAANFDISFDCYPQRFLTSGKTPVPVAMNTNSTSGTVIDIQTDNAKKISKAEVTFVLHQDVSNGVPSPTNVCPITGATSANLYVSGKNLFTGSFTSGKNIDSSGAITNSNSRCATLNGIRVKPETQYTISLSSGSVGVYYYNSNDVFLSMESGWGATPRTFTTPANAAFVRFSYNSGTAPTSVQLEYGASATTYETAPVAYAVSFSSYGTVYAGTYEFSTGKLIVTYKGVLGSDVTWGWFTHASGDVPYFDPADKKKGKTNYRCSAYNVINGAWQTMLSGETTETDSIVRIVVRDSRFTDLATAETLLANVQFVYELATPLEYTLTPQQMQTLAGQNYIWSTEGNLDLSYLTAFEITNPTQYDAKPRITLTSVAASAEVQFGGERTITLTATTSYQNTVVIDCDEQNVYDAVTLENKNDLFDMPDGFPVLNSGMNKISISGTISSVSLEPRWWEL